MPPATLPTIAPVLRPLDGVAEGVVLMIAVVSDVVGVTKSVVRVFVTAGAVEMTC